MQCCVIIVLINEVPKFLAPIPSETKNVTQVEYPFFATYPIIIPLKLNRVPSFFEVRIHTLDKYEDQNFHKIE